MEKRATKRENMFGSRVGYRRAEDSKSCFAEDQWASSPPFYTAKRPRYSLFLLLFFL